ncbi:ABC transporter permease [Kineosporia sp. NBRC 101731]|uniref:ABC transporter permease n=1 Tax=Kineosporia sp. NBRC 101731 TaxID=3032199 RepID=UPI0024A11CBB|nr:ABC transporter permease [Kineosporia sp. NBRC 101731]GLY27292.1 transport permease protein [Kineosporia sp. NBRC 101731]
MSTAITDSVTMFTRQTRRLSRYPELTVIVLTVPIVFLLLFAFVFGGTLGAGLNSGATGDRGDYVNYVMPGILLMTISMVAAGTSTGVTQDMTTGIMARFRTLSISPGSVLTGHALASVVQSLISLVIVIVVGLLIGFRPGADLLGWLGAMVLLAGLSLAIAWLAVAGGLIARSVETASNFSAPLTVLPFLGSGFVPTDSMPGPLAWFAEYQPFTPIMDTLRALMLGTPLGAGTAAAAAGWCVALTAIGYAWSRRVYARPRRV